MDENGLLSAATSLLSPGACALSVAPTFLPPLFARDRARAHSAVFDFYLHFLTARHKTLFHCTLQGEGNVVIYLHLLLHLVQTEGEREKKPSFTKINTTTRNPSNRKGEGNFADCLHPYFIHAQEDKPIR